MAKRVSIQHWHDEAVRLFGTNVVTDAQLNHIKTKNDWLFSGALWQNRDVHDKNKVNIPNVNGVAINPGESETVKPGGTEVEAEHFVDRVSVDELFSDLGDLVEIVASGKRPSLLITGGAGTGKSHTVFETLKNMGLEKGEDWVLVKGKTTSYGVYRTLFMNRHKIIVYDDSDDVFAGADTRNLLKAALDSYGERIISWQSKLTVDIRGSAEEKEAAYLAIEERLLAGDDALLPSEFDFKGKVIFISNLSQDKIEPAIRSRSLMIDVTLTPSEIFDRIEKVMDKINPEGYVMSLDEKKEVLEFLRENAKNNPGKHVSLRDFIGAIMIKASGNPRWQKLLRYS